MPRRLIDLSHPIESGMAIYPGLPAPRVDDHMTFEGSRGHYAPGVEFRIGRMELVGNAGTYLDAPGHRHRDGVDIGELPLEAMTDLPGVVVRVPVAGGRGTTRQRLVGVEVAGRAVLFHTGWDARWGTPDYFQGHPFLMEDAALELKDRGALLVGMDTLNVDDTTDARRPVHTLLLGAGIPIVENLTGLGELPAEGFVFSAVPPKVTGMTSFPVRAWARLAHPAPASPLPG